ncbi:MAG: glycogen-debranching protein, partial [Myxococcales bacterium]|nr:glycogen-debranching protein [Myxococcales bacterium]
APDAVPDAAPPPTPLPPGSQGARIMSDLLELRLFSAGAQRVEAWLYADPFGEPVGVVPLVADADGVWSAALERPAEPLWYGYRLWGPNWPHDPAWAPGNEAGFLADVDAAGHRFNPNKLVLDPYAREISHDPFTPPTDGRRYGTGPEHRALDSGPVAPKGLAWAPADAERPAAPTRPFRDEIIYEVHLRGLTAGDASLPEAERGTYAGAARKARWLRELGITAVEFLPLHETQNDQNDLSEGTAGDNYWGYSTLGYFAPDRRLAADQGPGGPTRELKAMVDAFHAEGLKVYVDVVYNHSGEGGNWTAEGDTAALLSLRGVDNATYYQAEGAAYFENNGVGPNLRFTHPQTRRLVIDSLRYLHEDLGVDGFRFDLASVLGNGCDGLCFEFGRGGLLSEIAAALPVRPEDGGPGVDLIAEPWALGPGSYQVGEFPAGWAEWNDQYRDMVRDQQNRAGDQIGRVANRVHGSSDLFRDDGRRPWHSVNFIVAHDGLTLADLYACNGKHNDQPWPYGPSDGGTDNDRAWDQGGDPAAQRQAARTGLAVLLLSAGVPMITGGDESLRGLRCNNNPYNLDAPTNWLAWELSDAQQTFQRFARALLALRQAHPALRPARFTEGVDRNGDGVLDLTWLGADGQPHGDLGGAYRFLAWRLDGAEVGDPAASIYVAWNWDEGPVRAHVPAPRTGHRWAIAADTAAWLEPEANHYAPGEELPLPGLIYDLAPRSLLVLLEQPLIP